MSDFFNNLLQRSAPDSSVVVSLRPRLPSLFEPLHGADKFPVPAADSLERRSVAPPVVPTSVERLQTKMSSARSTIRIEHKPSHIMEENQPRMKSHAPSISSEQATKSNTSPKTRVEKFETSFEEPLTALVPEETKKPSPNKTFRREEDTFPSVDLDRRKEPLKTESLPIQVQKAPERVFPQEPINNQRETSIKPMKDSSVPENVVTARREAPKTQPDPTSALRPLIPAPRLTERPRLEPPQQQEQPRVVEIHIGRIEVRAMTAPATPPTKPRPTGVMTLDEYLQRRNTRDH